MRILHLISSGGMYGAETMLLNLARNLRARECELAVGVFRNGHNPHLEIAERLSAEGIPVTVITCAAQLDFSAVSQIRRLMKQGGFGLLHTHGYKADIYGYVATLFSKLPVVATCHNWTGKSEIPAIYGNLDRMILRQFSRVAAVSDGVAQVLLQSGVPKQKIARISNGVDVVPFERAIPTLENRPSDADGAVVGMVGRLVREKGCAYFLRSAERVLGRFPRTRFLLIGDGPERSYLEELARQLRIQENVAFLGHRNDMPGIYASLDISVLPSLIEGMPMAVLESMAGGKPLIATSVGEVPKIVDSGQDGLLVTPGNTAELSAAMVRLLGDTNLRLRMGENGRQKARKSFSADIMAHAYLTLYTELLYEQGSQAAASLQRA